MDFKIPQSVTPAPVPLRGVRQSVFVDCEGYMEPGFTVNNLFFTDGRNREPIGMEPQKRRTTHPPPALSTGKKIVWSPTTNGRLPDVSFCGLKIT
jgi:hypothetical protein